MWHGAPRMGHQNVQQIELSWCEPDLLTILLDQTLPRIQLKDTHVDRHLGRIGRGTSTTHGSTDPCREFSYLKRFGDVVICTGIQRFNLVLFIVTNGHDED